jgi:hypothetical protein
MTAKRRRDRNKEPWYLRGPAAARDAATRAGRQARQVVTQNVQRAREKGHDMARRLITTQRAADLPEHLVERSAKSVTDRDMARPSDRQWQKGYTREAQARVPGIRPADREAGQ